MVCRSENALLRSTLDSLPDSISVKDLSGRFVLINPAGLRRLRAATAAEVIGKTVSDFFEADQAARCLTEEQGLLRSGEAICREEAVSSGPGAEPGWACVTKSLLRDPAGKPVGVVTVVRDITARKTVEDKLGATQRDLAEASRYAGMAEVATGVLHNVGNVLNSVNVSSTIVAQRLRESKVSGVSKLSSLFQEHRDDIESFLLRDERGRQVPAYLEQLAQHLEQEQAEVRKEFDSLARNIDHIKEIVSMQQNYAVIAGVVESVSLADLVEDAIKIHAGALLRHSVTVLREFAPVPAILVDKHKVLQILVNLFSNAKYACEAGSNDLKQITARILARDGGRVQIQIADNGIGIAPENVTRIFSQGFTTRKGGHGFGLHSGVRTASELGGVLIVQSEGINQGATFILELPPRPPKT